MIAGGSIQKPAGFRGKEENLSGQAGVFGELFQESIRHGGRIVKGSVPGALFCSGDREGVGLENFLQVVSKLLILRLGNAQRQGGTG